LVKGATQGTRLRVRMKEVTQGHKVEGEGVNGVRVTVSHPSPSQRFLSNKKKQFTKI